MNKNSASAVGFVAIGLFCGTVQAASVSFGDVVKKSEATQQFCPDSREGGVCLMPQQAAEKYCRDQKMRLPTTRDFAEYFSPYHATPGILAAPDVPAARASGYVYYRVDSQEEDGTFDTFFFSNDGFSLPPGEWKDLQFWTSSVVPFCVGDDSKVHPCGPDEYANAKKNTVAREKSTHAHVFYGSLGGGGGDNEQHRRTFPNAVRCVASSR